MDINSDKYYPYGISGHNYLIVHGKKLFHYQTLSDHSIQVIECNLEEKSMKVTTKTTGSTEWREIDLSELKNGESIQCNEGKNHWEGSSLKGVPFGFGCYYNEQNKIRYSGFMYEGSKVCTGVDYNEMTGLVEYEGNYYLNKRHGYGKWYNEKGELIYKGNWYFGSKLESRWNCITTSKNKLEEINYKIRSILIDEYSGDSIVMNGFSFLYQVEILENICQNVKTFEISNCNELQEIKVKYKSKEKVEDNVEEDTNNMEVNGTNNVDNNGTNDVKEQDTKNKTAYNILNDRLYHSDNEMHVNDGNDDSDDNEDNDLPDTPIDSDNEQDIKEEVQDEESDEEESEEVTDNIDYDHYFSSNENIFMIHHCSYLRTIDLYRDSFNNSIYCVRLFDLPKLQSFDFLSDCFQQVEVVHIDSKNKIH